jgi:hypothetical protein
MKLNKILTVTAAVVLSTAAFFPVAAQAQVGVNLVIGNAPPPPRYEVVPAPRRGSEWIPGYWNWNGRRHVWVNGHWERVRSGYYYEPASWVQVDNGWRLQRGGWNQGNRDHRGRGGNGGDRDRDGVPNRVDRDRDGDGVPNRADRAPDNARRN